MNCLSCGGLIMEPNRAYGYAGPVCYCQKDPRHQYQRPSQPQAQPAYAPPDVSEIEYADFDRPCPVCGTFGQHACSPTPTPPVVDDDEAPPVMPGKKIGTFIGTLQGAPGEREELASQDWLDAKSGMLTGTLVMPEGKVRIRKNDALRFWIKVNAESSGCFVYGGSINEWGYGSFAAEGKTTPAHRFAWEMEKGPIPEGLVIRHLCNNPACVNIEHLAVGTHKDNATDREVSGRGGGAAVGEGNPKCALDEETAIRIYIEGLSGASNRDLGRKYGVDRTTAGRISNGSAWSHLKLKKIFDIHREMAAQNDAATARLQAVVAPGEREEYLRRFVEAQEPGRKWDTPQVHWEIIKAYDAAQRDGKNGGGE